MGAATEGKCSKTECTKAAEPFPSEQDTPRVTYWELGEQADIHPQRELNMIFLRKALCSSGTEGVHPLPWTAAHEQHYHIRDLKAYECQECKRSVWPRARTQPTAGPVNNNVLHGQFVEQRTRMGEDMGLQYTLAAQLNVTALWEGCRHTVVACAWKICREIHLCCVNLFHCDVLTVNEQGLYVMCGLYDLSGVGHGLK